MTGMSGILLAQQQVEELGVFQQVMGVGIFVACVLVGLYFISIALAGRFRQTAPQGPPPTFAPIQPDAHIANQTAITSHSQEPVMAMTGPPPSKPHVNIYAHEIHVHIYPAGQTCTKRSLPNEVRFPDEAG